MVGRLAVIAKAALFTIEKLIDTIRPLRLDGTLGHFGTLANAGIFTAAVAQRSDVYTGPGVHG